ncbi:hypothetical protein FOZ61_002157 [Perkinsus olseni]|uniref:Uncharacterized protein n=1 Tax=Perkinsus olseni TaxID=32597 RepID=A0A7J6LTZ9_PEROL|nr:hypothetical protein FOZ61_002157 [Perkinsus olseni]KAF4670629.1 hypothetical protein FOL46_000722 [Perkinsus olseni]
MLSRLPSATRLLACRAFTSAAVMARPVALRSAVPPTMFRRPAPINRFTRRGFASEAATGGQRKDEILKQLSLIIDPDLHKDIVSLGFVQNLSISDDGVVVFDLKLTTPACPVRDQFVDACSRACKALPWVTDVKVTLSAKSRAGAAPEVKSENLSKVHNIIAVTSCKGGVGKSSVAVNLAYSIAKHGVKVGILDADIFGPSLPYLIPSTERAPPDAVEGELEGAGKAKPGVLQPYYHNGVKLMSMGYLRPGESVALRGPMVSGMVQQMLTMTDWGNLDYLIIDYPPGTGDIQLTIGQQAKVDAAVVVTTPQQLSLVDVEKGIELFDKLNIPSIAVVENMAYFKCPSCSDKHQVFGRAAESKKLAAKYGIQSHVELPIDPDMAGTVEDAKGAAFPFVCNEAYDGSEASKAFENLAEDVIRGVSKVQHGATHIAFMGAGKPIIHLQEQYGDHKVAWQGQVPARALRLACRSASMYDEWTGEKLFKDEDIPQDVVATNIAKAGTYALRINWSDGHTSIFPRDAMKKVVQQHGIVEVENGVATIAYAEELEAADQAKAQS